MTTNESESGIAGAHPARAVAFVFAAASTGNPQVGVAFRIAAGRWEGHEITWYGPLGSDAAIKQTVRALRECGAVINSNKDFKVLRGLGDKVVPIHIVEEPNPNTGEIQAKVEWVGSRGPHVSREAHLSDRALDDLSVKVARVMAKAANGAAAPMPADDGPDLDADELPL